MSLFLIHSVTHCDESNIYFFHDTTDRPLQNVCLVSDIFIHLAVLTSHLGDLYIGCLKTLSVLQRLCNIELDARTVSY